MREQAEIIVTTEKLSHKTDGTFAVLIKIEGLPTEKLRDELSDALQAGVLAFFNEDDE